MTSGDFKTSYQSDMAIFQTGWVKLWMGLFFVLLLVFPFITSSYFIYIINLSGIAIIAALGLNLLTGYTGQISLAHASFLAIGAYSSAILTSDAGLSFWIAMPLSGLIAAIIGLLIGIPALRLKGFYIAIVTLGFALIIEHIIVRWDSLTRGAEGMAVPPIKLGDFVFRTDRGYYFLILFMVIIAVLFAKNLVRTKVGRAFMAIRDRDISAKVIGVDLTKYKIIAFFISSFYAGIAGSLYAHYLAFIGLEHFTLMVSIEYIAMVIVGGMGSILGSIYGALFITLLPEGIRLLTDPLSISYPVLAVRFGDFKAAVYGLIIILFLIFEPDGFYGRWQTIKIYWKNWPFTY